MALISLLTAALGTAAGKAAAVAAVSAATAGGLAATDVVELPTLSDKPAEVTTDDQGETPELPTESQTGQDAAEAKGGNADIAEEKRQDDDAEAEIEETDAADPDANDFGQRVAADAQTDGVDGQVIAGEARAGTPAEDRAAQPGAPETAGERQDDTVRADDGAGQDAEAPQGAEVADEHTPEQADDAGSQAEGRRGGPAADTES